MRFRDRQGKEIEITLIEKESKIDWTASFYNAGCLEFVESDNLYLVKDTEMLLESAIECMQHVGDYEDLNSYPHVLSELYVNGKRILEEVDN